jgi:hypothetical protein
VHAWWACGGSTGHGGIVPSRDGRPLFRPGRWPTALVALALGLAGLLVAARALGWLGGTPALLATAACWLLAAAFLARAVGDFRYVGLCKRVRDTAFGLSDTAAYTPLCLLLGLAIAATATA